MSHCAGSATDGGREAYSENIDLSLALHGIVLKYALIQLGSYLRRKNPQSPLRADLAPFVFIWQLCHLHNHRSFEWQIERCSQVTGLIGRLLRFAAVARH